MGRKENLIVQNKILRSLLESPKTTGQLCIALGYVSEDGAIQYHNISVDLIKLEKRNLITKKIIKKYDFGRFPTTYFLKGFEKK
jgi:hypothetical protein